MTRNWPHRFGLTAALLASLISTPAAFGEWENHGVSLGKYEEPVWCVAFSPDGKILATGGREDEKGIVNFWDVKKKELLATYPLGKQPIRVLAFSPDGQTIAVQSEKGIQLRAVKDFKPAPDLENAESATGFFAFSPDGRTLAATIEDESKVCLWDLKTRKAQTVFSWGDHKIVWMKYSPDGKYFAAGDKKTSVAIWDASNMKAEPAVIRTGHKRDGVLVDFAPDGKTLATAGFVGSTIHLWRPTAKEKLLKTLDVGEHDGVLSLAFSPDGRWLASGGDHAASVWTTDTYKFQAITGFNKNTAVLGVAFSPNSRLLAAVGGSVFGPGGVGEVRLWEIPSTDVPNSDKKR